MDSSGKVINFATVQLSGLSRIFKVTNDGINDGQCSVDGFHGNFYSDFILDPLRRHGYNCTIEEYGQRAVSHGTGDGYIGHIKDGVKDGLLFLVSSPPLTEGIKATAAVRDTFLELGSSYNYTNEADTIDIIDLYWNLDISYYILFLVQTFILTLSWTLIRSLIGAATYRPLSLLWSLVRISFRQDSYLDPWRGPFLILCTFASLQSFLIWTFAMNVIGTDLVVFKEPKVIASYADIVAADDIKVMFFEEMYENNLFENAPIGSLEQKIWQKRFLVPTNQLYTAMIRARSDAVAQKLVAILRDYFIEVSFNFGVQQNRLQGLDNIRGLIVRDPTGKHFTDHFIYSDRAPEFLKDLFETCAYVMRESGIAEYNRKSGLLSVLFPDFIAAGDYDGRYIHKGSMPPPYVSFQHLDKFLAICTIPITIATIVLMVEVTTYRNKFGLFTIKRPARARKRRNIKIMHIKKIA